MFKFFQQKLVKAQLIPSIAASSTEQSILYEQLGTFLLNPSSFSESKSANWTSQAIPGLSSPHFQWTSSGARTINFEALVTKDFGSFNQLSQNLSASVNSSPGKTSIIKKVGGIAKQIFGVEGISDLSNQNNQRVGASLDLNINDKLNYYRSLLYPRLSSASNTLSSAPYKVKLLVGEVLGARSFNISEFIVTKIDIQITKMSPTLQPIEAKVSFSLTEFTNNNVSADSILTDV